MSLCVGVDFSTKRIDVAAIPLDPDVPGGPWIVNAKVGSDRYASVYYTVRHLLRHHADHTNQDIATVCIEKPGGRHIHPSLHELHGVIRAAIPYPIPSTSLYPVQWRQAIGCRGRDTKAAGHARIHDLYPGLEAWDEHELDATGIARGWANIQWKETA